MKICRIEDCNRKITTASWSGLCARHMKNLRIWGDTDGDPKAAKPRPKDCAIEGCERPRATKTLCAAHHSRLRRKGDVQADLPIGPAPKVVTVPVVMPPRMCAQKGCDTMFDSQTWNRKYCDVHATKQAAAARSNATKKAREIREQQRMERHTMGIYGPDTTPHEHVYRCQDCGEIAPAPTTAELGRLADALSRRFLQRDRSHTPMQVGLT